MGLSSQDKLHRSSRKSRSSARRDRRHQSGAPAASAASAAAEMPELAAAAAVGGANHCPEQLGFSTEEQLEEMLMSSLEMLYGEAVSRLVSLGYDEGVAMTSVLRNGHCYGSLDVLTNVLENALTFINGDGDGGGGVGGQGFGSLRQLQEYTLAGMVCLLQQVRPQLSRAEAMWCLLMSDLDLGQASTIEIPNRSPPPSNMTTTAPAADHHYDCGSVDGVCELHVGCGGAADLAATGSAFDASAVMDFAAVRASEIECPKRFNLSPKMESLLKRNVAIFGAGFRACSKQSNSCNDDEEGCISVALPKIEDGRGAQSVDVVNSVLDSLGNLSMNDKPDGQVDQEDEMVLNLVHQMRELEVQLKERREWAHQKALQAAKKLSNDLTELKMLRMEREETLGLKKGKQTLEDSTMKKLSEMENALKKASSQVDLANAAIRRLENENAEMRAEREASRLSASESVNTCLEVAKREKKCLKRLLNWEKQKVKLEEEIKRERESIEQLQHQIVQVMEAQKETEARLKQEVKAKEAALACAEKERRAKEASEVKVKQSHEALERKIEIDFQRHKDDIQRLEDELSRFKASAELSQLSNPTNTLLKQDLDSDIVKQTRREFQPEVTRVQDATKTEVTSDRQCVICTKNEVSVVLLPCAHQVLCVKCNQNHEKAYRVCPCCNVKIDQRILVYGASS